MNNWLMQHWRTLQKGQITPARKECADSHETSPTSATARMQKLDGGHDKFKLLEMVHAVHKNQVQKSGSLPHYSSTTDANVLRLHLQYATSGASTTRGGAISIIQKRSYIQVVPHLIGQLRVKLPQTVCIS
jgi:hypothetical protein